ncbi:MAG: HD domain-containing protein [Armatimonadota bacterium]
MQTQLRDIAGDYLGGAGGSHQLDHTLRVVENALALAAHYPEVDRDALEAAAWLHDVGRGQGNHAEASARIAAERLPALGFSPERTGLIVRAIADHRFSAGRIPASPEGKILQDADRLDALGAIGIARALSFEVSRELYDPADPFAERRAPDDARYTVDHFYAKLLRLPETLHTPEARKMAQRRAGFMRIYLHELADEIGVPYPARDDR